MTYWIGAIAALLFGALSLSAQPGVWATYGPKLEISVEVISEDTAQAGTIYVGTTSNGVFRSTNGGINWRQANLPLSSGRVSALLPETGAVYAALGSSDTQSSSAPRGVFRSSDGGISWLPANPPLQGMDVLALRRFGGRLYAGTAQLGLFYSSNGGIDWNAVAEPLNFGPVALLEEYSGVLFAGTINQGLYFSADSGASWTRAAFDGALTQNLTVSALTRVGDVIFAGVSLCFQCSGIFASSDGGANFFPISPAPNGPFIYSLISSGSNIFAATETGIFSSNDGGNTWIQSPEPLQSTAVLSLYQHNGVVLAGTRGAGLFRSFDNGRTWEALPPNDLSTQTVQVLRPAGDVVYAGTREAGLFRSDAGGGNWFVREVKANQAINGVIPGDILTLAYGSGIYRSVDGGFNWETAESPMDVLGVLTVLPYNNLLIAGSSGGGLWHSRDGLSWTRSPAPAANSTIAALLASGSQVFAASNPGIFVSGDGEHWTATGAPPRTYLSLLETNGMIYTGTEGAGIARSSDQGISWEFAGGAIANKTVEKVFVAGGILHAATRNNGLFRSDDGQNWLSSGIPMANKTVNDMRVFNGRIFAATGSTDPFYGVPNTGLFISSDNGLTWQEAALPDNEINVTSLVQVNDFIYAGGSKQFISADGLIWNPIGLGLRADRVNQLASYAFPGEARLYAASTNGIFFQNIDQAPPLAQGITPAGGAGFSGERDLTLLLAATGADSVIIAEDSTFSNSEWLAYNEFISYRLSDGDGEKALYARFKDLSWNLSGMVQTSVILDTEPPVFAPHAAPQRPSPGGNVTVRQDISDANPEINAIYFRRAGEPFSENRRVLFEADSAQIDGGFLTNRGLDYRIIATDQASLSDTLRNGSLDFFSLPVILSAGELGSSPGLPGGIGGSAFRVVSAPIQLERAASPTAIFGELGPYGPEGDWIAWQYAGGDQWISGERSTLSTGESLFLLLRDGRTLTNRISGTSAKTTDGVLGEIPGWQLRGNDWTLVGNPYNVRIDLGLLKLKRRNLRLNQADSAFQVWAYDGRAEDAGWSNRNLTLEPWGGLAIYVSSADTLVFANARDPYLPLPGLNKTPAPFSGKVAAGEAWRLQVRAEGNGFTDPYNYLGVQPGAQNGMDAHDGYEPPLLPGGISVCFTSPENHRGTAFSSDIRPAGLAGYAWEMQVRALKGSAVTLDFADIESIPAHFQAMLLDRQTNLLRDLRMQVRMEVRIPENQSVKNFTMLIGDPAYIQSHSNGLEALPQQFRLYQNYPNPFNPVTVIRYALPQRGEVTLKIYDILGREVRTLTDKRLREAGYYEAVADMREYSSGVYFYRITVEGKQRFQAVQKMLLVK